MGPCLDCTDRTVGCHGHCDKYISWSQEKQNTKDKIIENSKYDRLANNGQIESYRRHMPYKKIKKR